MGSNDSRSYSLARFKAILLDLGGVVYVGDMPLPGAIEAVDRLRGSGYAVRFVTNTTRSPRRRIVEKLNRMGLAISDEVIFTPAIAARRTIEQGRLAPHLLVHPDLEEDFAGLASGSEKALVVGDCGVAFDYASLNAAFRVLHDGAQFLALANNRAFQDADGMLSLDAGPFVAALAFASQREPVILGKPSAAFFDSALANVPCDPGEALMVGDDIENDVAGAMGAGLTGILVRTGKYQNGDEDGIDPPPGMVAPDLPAAVDWILSR